MKQYNGEKAIISLTSWKARINTVAKTLFSLIDKCPGFHIVLVLSEEEFPKKEDELPENLKIFIDNDLIEVLWVYKNYKSFKKVLFTMDKYRDVPVISADDDMIYEHNFADELYKEWLKRPNSVVANRARSKLSINVSSSGCGVLFPPNCFKNLWKNFIDNFNFKSSHDDLLYGLMIKKLGLPFFARKDNRCLSYQKAIGNSLHDMKMYDDEKQYDEYSSYFK